MRFLSTAVLRWLWGIALAGVVAGSLLPANSAVMVRVGSLPVSDKIMHFGAYAGLAFLPALHEARRRLPLIAVLLAALGVLMEFGQRYSVGRQYEVADMLANTAGIVCGLAVATAVRMKALRPAA